MGTYRSHILATYVSIANCTISVPVVYHTYRKVTYYNVLRPKTPDLTPQTSCDTPLLQSVIYIPNIMTGKLLYFVP
jgi:hypothetical protein